MKSSKIAIAILSSYIAMTSIAYAEDVAGTSTIGISVEESKMVATGFSAKKQILHKAVYNTEDKKIGAIDDIIVTPGNSVSYAVIGVGGFLGMDRHEVLIPFANLKTQNNKFILAGANKASLKALPAFNYSH